MHGKICMVTGANSGIGRAIATALVRLGATVVMVCRERETGQAAQDEIRRETDNNGVELMIADLSSQAAIRQLAADYRAAHDRLHVLINNAGVMLNDRALSADGIEMTFAVNVLAPFLLTHLLLDTLRASAPARVINTYGNASKLDFDNLQGERRYDMMTAYPQSKMANLLFTMELAKRLDGTGVTANIADPGFTASNLGRDARGSFKSFLDSARPTMRQPKQAAETAVYLASAPELEKANGKLYGDKRERSARYDPAEARRLWQICADLTGAG